MTSKRWPRGSQWRKWDLHVHSPASYGFKGDYNQLIIQLGGSTCDVIGINDYFSVAGYREVLRRLQSDGVGDGNSAYQKALEDLRAKTLLPVVECRMNNVLVNKKGQGQRINFHLIFDPDLDPENIETLLKAQKAPDGAIVGQRYNDSAFLMSDVSVDFKTMVEAVNSGEFAGRVLVWLPYDEYGGIDGIDPHTDKLFKANLVRTADILGSSNKKQRDFFLWKDANFTEADYRQWFGRRKPCIKGSDSHSVDEEVGALKDHDSNPTDRFCWIKADPTFEGLRQITNEPEDRVYIGRTPPKLAEVRAHPTRFIDRIRITKVAGADTGESWFDSDLPINADMVAIIGNKGSGKSAFADILAIAGNAHCKEADLSFLNATRFCQKNGRLAKNFEATVTWADGSQRSIGLHKKPDFNDVELIRYIPQSYLEKVCTENEPGQQSQFQVELRKVIFSHIGDADALGKGSLDELIAYRTEELQTQIGASRRELNRINGEITRLEAKITTDHIAQLEAKLRHKQQELTAHQGIRPAPVERPDSVAPDQQAALDDVSGKLTAERDAVTELDAAIVASQASQRVATEQIALLRKIEGKIDNFATEYANLERETTADLEKLGIAFAEAVLEHLRVDMRTVARTPTGVAAQLRKNVDVKSLYDFIWGFEYLEPEYSLRFDGKDLSLLSPGERGTLLLIFYLLVDKSNTPIIVDQPEENLDSQTVFKLLIPVIKEVKRRRQIIMVTHSPNIAVVCDAEQIIHSRIDRAADNKVIYAPGAIEAPEINRYLVDVLEGTRPAFENRDSKYFSGA